MSSIVLVTIDSLRADHVGCYSYDRDTSPAIDALAERGIQFDGYANAPATRASFPSLLTSTYPLEYGGFWYLSDQRTVVSQPLSAAGYETAGFHSNLWLSADYNYDRGFDRFYDSKSEPSLLARLRSWVNINIPNDTAIYSALQGLYNATEEKAGVNVGKTYKDAEIITDRAIEWMEQADDQFFCWVHYMDVHHPYVPRNEARDELGLDFDISKAEAIQLRRKMLEAPDDLTDDERQALVDLYDAELRYTDSQIGRLLDRAEAATDDELGVVLTADHGEEFYDHGKYSHHATMYDEVLHVPFIVDPPASVADDIPSSPSEPLELLDVGPTVCDLAGVDSPSNYRGRSALDVAGSNETVGIISETDAGEEYKLSIREDGWKFIWDREHEQTELYDLNADPDETENVVDDHTDRTAQMRETLRSHIEEIRASNESLPDVAMDSTTEERLRDLGYLD